MLENLQLEPITISSEKIILEPVSFLWIEDFHEYSIHPELYKHLEFPPFQKLEETRTYLQKLIDRSDSPLAQYWFILSKEHDKVIGSFGIHDLDLNRKSAEIGYGISPHYWGKGYFSEALRLAMKHAFDNLCLHRLVARTSVLNTASINGLKKFGFLKEATMKDYYRDTDGKWFDAVLMAKLNKN
jgi:ribosomal-protein-alanine N-acetyltransferase